MISIIICTICIITKTNAQTLYIKNTVNKCANGQNVLIVASPISKFTTACSSLPCNNMPVPGPITPGNSASINYSPSCGGAYNTLLFKFAGTYNGIPIDIQYCGTPFLNVVIPGTCPQVKYDVTAGSGTSVIVYFHH